MKYLLIFALSLILSACADEPARSMFPSQHVVTWHDENGKIHLVGVSSAEPTKPLTITGEPMHLKPLGWGGAGHTEFQRYDPFNR